MFTFKARNFLIVFVLLFFLWLTTISFETASEVKYHRPLPDAIENSDFYDNGQAPKAKVELGRLLFFDKILSGNKNISCATCHHPKFASGDRVALPIGEGASGLGSKRKPGTTSATAVYERVPRNSPALFNLGAREFVRLFHDGRVEVDSFGYYQSGFITPARWKLPKGLDNVLAAQALFPVASPTEMAGQRGENTLAKAQALNNLAGDDGLWQQLAERLQNIPKYVEMFKAAFPEKVQQPQDVSMVLAANAIAAFEATAFRSDQSPFDKYLRSGKPLPALARRGMKLFYGKAGCVSCHSGKFQTDHAFHAIAMPQIGPGKNDGNNDSYWNATGMKDYMEDFGRGRVTYRKEDNFKFRTPSLRNVALTAPYGHDGAYTDLEAVIRHHLNPIASLESYQLSDTTLQPLQVVLELTANGPKLNADSMSDKRRKAFLMRDSWVHRHNMLRGKIAAANELQPRPLRDCEVDALVAFMHSLTDLSAHNLEHLTPANVPSGLAVED